MGNNFCLLLSSFPVTGKALLTLSTYSHLIALCTHEEAASSSHSQEQQQSKSRKRRRSKRGRHLVPPRCEIQITSPHSSRVANCRIVLRYCHAADREKKKNIFHRLYTRDGEAVEVLLYSPCPPSIGLSDRVPLAGQIMSIPQLFASVRNN